MAEIRLLRNEAEQPCRLPLICVRCGQGATTVEEHRFTSAPIPPPILDFPVGCLLAPLWIVTAVLIHSSRKEITARLPFCEKHARGWFTEFWLSAKSVTDTDCTLGGVSEAFAQAVERQRIGGGRFAADIAPGSLAGIPPC